MIDSPFTGRGLRDHTDRAAYNTEARRIGHPMRVCEFCVLETRTQCRQADGGAPGWYANAGTVSCGPCRHTEYVSRTEIRTAQRGMSDEYFGPGEDMR